MFLQNLKQFSKPWLIKLLFGDRGKIVIASNGRSGSTMLHRAVAESLVTEKLMLAPGSWLSGRLSNMISDYIDRLSELPLHPELVCKTHDEFDGLLPDNVKCLFIYGDPLDSALSVEQMVRTEGKSWFGLHQYHLKAEGAYEKLFEADVLNYKGQLESWLSSSSRQVMCVDYDDLWNERDSISSFLGFELLLPERKQRKVKSYEGTINTQFFEELRKIKVRLKQQYKSRNGS